MHYISDKELKSYGCIECNNYRTIKHANKNNPLCTKDECEFKSEFRQETFDELENRMKEKAKYMQIE